MTRARKTTVGEFLGLSSGEMAVVKLRAAIASALRDWREAENLSWQEAAKKLRVGPPLLQFVEDCDPEVPLDMAFDLLFALGVARVNIALNAKGEPSIAWGQE